MVTKIESLDWVIVNLFNDSEIIEILKPSSSIITIWKISLS